MNLDELRTVQSKERRKDSLQHLRDPFYGDVADYIAERKAERKNAAAQADDPFSSPEVSQLTDEIETAEEVIEAIYERRVGKVVKLASFAAADMPVDQNGMTGEEKSLFEDLVVRIERNKTNVLDILAGKRRPDEADESEPVSPLKSTKTTPDALSESMDDVEPTSMAETSSESASDRSNGVLADAMDTGSDDSGGTDETDETGTESARTPVGPEHAPPGATQTDDADSAPADDHERITIRVTRDIGEIFGVDEREYDLASEDVVTLPTANAEPLIEHEAAERLD